MWGLGYDSFGPGYSMRKIVTGLTKLKPVIKLN